MKPKLLLRIAAALMLMHALGHTMGALSWKENDSAAVRQVIAGMQQHRFQFMGKSSTLADYYEGYGICMIFVLLTVSACLWILSGHSEQNPLSRKITTVLSIFLVVFAAGEFHYFFAFAASTSLLAGILAGAGAYLMKRTG